MRAKISVFLAAILVCGSAAAWQAPKVEYSADSTFESSEAVMNGRVYVAPGKERREFEQGGDKMVMIVRRDKGKIWNLMPSDKMYMSVNMPKGGRKDDVSRYKIKQTVVGSETVNGVKTTKSKIIMIGPDGSKLGGFWWRTKEGIVVKMDAISVDKSSKMRIKSELSNLRIGKQKASLFEIPSDYEKMSMGGLMGGGGQGDSEDNDGGKKKGKFGIGNALELLK